MNHQEPDRVPVDMGSIVSTVRTVEAYKRLKAHMGLAMEEKIRHLADEHVIPSEDLLQALGVDTRYVRLRPPRSWKGRVSPDRRTVVDEWGAVWSKPPGNIYFTITENPLNGAELDDLETYPWPDPADPSRYEGLRDEVQRLYRETPYALVADIMPAEGVFGTAWRVRGMENLMMDMAADPGFAEALLHKVTDIYQEIYARYMEAVGDYVQMVIYSSDLSSQDGPLMSLEHYRRFIKPCQRRIFDTIRRHTQAKLCVHICGSAYPFLPDLIELGVEVINPVQTSARDMDPEKLKLEFGDRLSFFGAVDTQRFLPNASHREIREEVRRLIGTLGRGGGYLAASCHSIQPDVSPDRICQLFAAFAEFGRYPLN